MDVVTIIITLISLGLGRLSNWLSHMTNEERKQDFNPWAYSKTHAINYYSSLSLHGKTQEIEYQEKKESDSGNL